MLKSVITIAGNSISLGYAKPSADRNTLPSTPRASGVIKGMSRRALSNLMREINRLTTAPTHFAVLNFPPGSPIDPLFVRHAIKILGQRLVRRFPANSMLWRVEFTKKGIPHIHLLGDFGSISEDLLTEWLFTVWRTLLGFESRDSKNIVYVRAPLGSKLPQTVRYFCKAKENDEIGAMLYCRSYDSTGRCCGHFNRSKANLAPVLRRLGNETQRKKIVALLVEGLEKRLADIKPGVNVMARQAFIDRVANGNDTCLHFQTPELIEEVRAILSDAA